MSTASRSRMSYLLQTHFTGPSAVKATRLAQGLTLSELAAAAGVPRSVLIAAEAGHPTADAVWLKLAHALQVPAEWLRAPDPEAAARIRAATGGFDSLEMS